MKKLFYFSVILMGAFYSCKKETTPAPAPPVITFGSFTTLDIDNAILTLNFTDADGDIGLNQSDTSGNFATGTVGYYDFYMRYYYFSPSSSKYVPYYFPFGTDLYIDSAISRYRIPFVTNNAKSKSLDGQIIINIYEYKPPGNDSINNFRYEFWIYDRALHKSNVVTTPGFHTNY